MSVTYYSVLGLSQNYTLEDLENAYNAKTKSIMELTTLGDIEKHLLISSLKKYFDQAYMALVRRHYFSTENLLAPSFETSIFRSRLPAFGSSFRDMDTLFQNMERDISSRISQANQDPQTTVYSSSSSYREKLMPDGSKIVLRESSSNRNGEVSRSTNSYRQLSSGITEPIEYDQALQQIENKILK